MQEPRLPEAKHPGIEKAAIVVPLALVAIVFLTYVTLDPSDLRGL
jgi:hypothetical protein